MAKYLKTRTSLIDLTGSSIRATERGLIVITDMVQRYRHDCGQAEAMELLDKISDFCSQNTTENVLDLTSEDVFFSFSVNRLSVNNTSDSF